MLWRHFLSLGDQGTASVEEVIPVWPGLLNQLFAFPLSWFWFLPLMKEVGDVALSTRHPSSTQAGCSSRGGLWLEARLYLVVCLRGFVDSCQFCNTAAEFNRLLHSWQSSTSERRGARIERMVRGLLHKPLQGKTESHRHTQFGSRLSWLVMVSKLQRAVILLWKPHHSLVFCL